MCVPVIWSYLLNDFLLHKKFPALCHSAMPMLGRFDITLIPQYGPHRFNDKAVGFSLCLEERKEEGQRANMTILTTYCAEFFLKKQKGTV